MIRLIITLLLTTSSFSANGQQNYCTHMESIARASMTARQFGVPLQSMLSLVSDETALGILHAAYEYPAHTNKNKQQVVIAEFSAMVLTHCLER